MDKHGLLRGACASVVIHAILLIAFDPPLFFSLASRGEAGRQLAFEIKIPNSSPRVELGASASQIDGAGGQNSGAKRRGQRILADQNRAVGKSAVGHRPRNTVAHASTPKDVVEKTVQSEEVDTQLSDPRGLHLYRIGLARQAAKLKSEAGAVAPVQMEKVVVLRLSSLVATAIPTVAIDCSSGSEILDNFAHQILSKAVALTPMPSELNRAGFSFAISIYFTTTE